MTTTYRADVPTLAIYIDGRLAKFVAHRLEVEDDQAEAVEAFAKAQPQYGIKREDATDEAAPEPETPKRETVEEIVTRVGDDKEAAQEALDAEQAADSPRSTLISALEDVILAEDPDADNADNA